VLDDGLLRVPGHVDHLQRRALRDQLPGQLRPADTRHHHVGQEHVDGRVLLEQPARFIRVGGDHHAVRSTRDQILLLRSEDLFGDPSATFARVEAFLELPHFVDPAFTVQNEGTGPRQLDPEVRAWLDDYYAEPNRRLAELTDGAITWP